MRYPGGKFRAVKILKKYIPERLSELCSPFFGGGSLELAWASEGIYVHGSDAFSPLINFWQCAKKNAILLAQQVEEFHPMKRDTFYSLQRNYLHLDNQPDNRMKKAAIFYALNRCSFSGTTLSGGMSLGHPRFNESAIERLRNFKCQNLKFQCMDYKEALAEHRNKFLYLDPPYATGGKLYGERGDMQAGFNHYELADILQKRKGWILSYNDCPQVRKLYRKYKIVNPKWTYGMNNNKSSNELLIICD